MACPRRVASRRRDRAVLCRRRTRGRAAKARRSHRPHDAARRRDRRAQAEAQAHQAREAARRRPRGGLNAAPDGSETAAAAGRGRRAPTLTPARLPEDAVALKVDHLSRLAERESDCVVIRREGVGADEAMLLAHAADLAFDDAGGLEMAFALVGRGADDEALVFDRLRSLLRGGSLAPA